MSRNSCMARLLASAVHDMRNILAVIRESAGLAQDLTTLTPVAQPDGNNKKELLAALDEVRHQVLLAAQLAEGLEFMAQADMNGEGAPCDLGRVCRLFCCMAARQARAAQIQLASGEHEGPVWAAVPPLEALHALLEVLDICVSVGGRVNLVFSAQRQESEGIAVCVTGGDNTALVLSALTGSALPGSRAKLLSGDAAGSFFLSWRAGEGA
ncbi:MAG: sensor histidine kinase [Desulfovibrionaceae bacterium]|nr:sensor histidine kinase [Desulfovibrionaceae bacterium]